MSLTAIPYATVLLVFTRYFYSITEIWLFVCVVNSLISALWHEGHDSAQAR